MINVTAQQLNNLRAAHSVRMLVDMTIGNSTFYLTTSDVDVQFNGVTYLPGIIEDIDDIEITSEPATNTINIDVIPHQNSLLALVLGGQWMNRPVVIRKQFYNGSGAILTKIAFEGLLSEYDYNAETDALILSVESIWADFEKTIGIKTNPVSYNRFFNATGFRHAANAINKIFWGREAPSDAGQAGGGTGGRFPEFPPEIN